MLHKAPKNMHKVLSFVGTRPEVIKMAPVLKALDAIPNVKSLLCTTGQHVQMVDQMLNVFDLDVDHKLEAGKDGEPRDLLELMTKILPAATQIIRIEKPDLVFVHGDTTTAFLGAMVAFYSKIPVAHVEAGLRTNNKINPFPEEMNRQMISRLSDLHFAPTPSALNSLNKENVSGRIHLVGNTIVDSIKSILDTKTNLPLSDLETWVGEKKMILVTCHRRESWGEIISHLCDTVLTLANNNPECHIVWPVHGNPNIAEPVKNRLCGHDRIQITNSLSYDIFVRLLNRANLILTDSGGVLEEAATLGRPVLVLRTETERPEALEPEVRILAGHLMASLSELASQWLRNPPKTILSEAFGDGTAGLQIARHSFSYLQEGGYA